MPIGEPFIILSSVDSTNKYAMQDVHDQLSTHGRAYFAMEQTQGRGQRGRQWQSGVGENLLLSTVWHIQQPFPAHPFLFSMAMALGCYRFFNKYAGEETSIKWPNDLYWRDRKAGGLLIENVLQGSIWKAAVVGTGININQTRFDQGLTYPVSLKQITGKTFDPIVLAKELCAELEKTGQLWKEDPESIVNAYNAALYKKDQSHLFHSEQGSFEGIVKEVNADGQLILLCPDEQAFDHGSLRWD